MIKEVSGSVHMIQTNTKQQKKKNPLVTHNFKFQMTKPMLNISVDTHTKKNTN